MATGRVSQALAAAIAVRVVVWAACVVALGWHGKQCEHKSETSHGPRGLGSRALAQPAKSLLRLLPMLLPRAATDPTGGAALSHRGCPPAPSPVPPPSPPSLRPSLPPRTHTCTAPTASSLTLLPLPHPNRDIPSRTKVVGRRRHAHQAPFPLQAETSIRCNSRRAIHFFRCLPRLALHFPSPGARHAIAATTTGDSSWGSGRVVSGSSASGGGVAARCSGPRRAARGGGGFFVGFLVPASTAA